MLPTIRTKIIKTFEPLLTTVGVNTHRRSHGTEPLEFLRAVGVQTVIDVGANTGQFAHSIRAVLPAAEIHSFEPQQDCYESLVASFKDDLRFKPYNYALGDIQTQASLYKNEYAPSSSFLQNSALNNDAFPHTQKIKAVEVPIMVLDSVLAADTLAKPILLKLDVQGYEDKVLLGSKKLLSDVAVCIVESSFFALYDKQPLFDDLYTLLRGSGFFTLGVLQENFTQEQEWFCLRIPCF